MKYLKKIEAVGWQEFVSLLTDIQFRNRVANKKFVDLTNQEEHSIINLVKPLVYTEEISLSSENVKSIKWSKRYANI